MAEQQMQLDVAPPPAVMRVRDDYGYIGSGACLAHSVAAENGEEYLAKAASFVPAHPYVAANEYVAARLARAIGLPILDNTILDLNGEYVFASSLMTTGTWHPQTTEELFQRCENRDRVYDLAVFDAWIANTDRHAGNLVVREIRARGGAEPRFSLLANDHSHCLVQPGEQPELLASRLDSPPPAAHLAYLYAAVSSTRLLRAALDKAEAVSDRAIAAIFDEMPATFVPSPPCADLMREYVLARRGWLTPIFRAHRVMFPSLDGGDL